MITLTLPWAVLVPDNAKTGVCRGKAILTARYRTAKRAATCLLRAQNGTATPRTTPTKVVVRVWFPDARKRDAGNLRKLVTDALQDAGVVVDDCLIHDERWIRAGIDRANPRADITVQNLDTRATLPLTPMGDPR